jgi:hypothetical protein
MSKTIIRERRERSLAELLSLQDRMLKRIHAQLDRWGIPEDPDEILPGWTPLTAAELLEPR